MSGSGYFDFNATTPLLPVAREAWLRASDVAWHNASGLYREGGAVRRLLEEARERLAELLGCEDEAARIVFTGGASESNNALFHAYAASRRASGRALISSELEHPSVREPLKAWGAAHVRHLPTKAEGIADLTTLPELLQQPTALVSLMAANNESGTLQPWREALAICRSAGVPFHTDASQWLGKLPCGELGQCDYLTGSGHKFGAPKGVGFLLLQSESEPLDYLRGGPQEEARRAGTENYPSIEAMVTSLEWLAPRLGEIQARQAPLREAFIARLKSFWPEAKIISEAAPCLWNTVMFVVPEGDNRKWCARLSQKGFALSTGSACSALKDGSSVVLAALGAGPGEAQRVLRVSGGWDSSATDWEGLADALQAMEISKPTCHIGKGG